MTSFFNDGQQQMRDVTVCDLENFRKMMVPFAAPCFVVSHYLSVKGKSAACSPDEPAWILVKFCGVRPYHR
jgi:hypothetical protein